MGPRGIPAGAATAAAATAAAAAECEPWLVLGTRLLALERAWRPSRARGPMADHAHGGAHAAAHSIVTLVTMGTP